jgi:hypothetical protein
VFVVLGGGRELGGPEGGCWWGMNTQTTLKPPITQREPPPVCCYTHTARSGAPTNRPTDRPTDRPTNRRERQEGQEGLTYVEQEHGRVGHGRHGPPQEIGGGGVGPDVILAHENGVVKGEVEADGDGGGDHEGDEEGEEEADGVPPRVVLCVLVQDWGGGLVLSVWLELWGCWCLKMHVGRIH